LFCDFYWIWLSDFFRLDFVRQIWSPVFIRLGQAQLLLPELSVSVFTEESMTARHW
jgi:hypothetical protein